MVRILARLTLFVMFTAFFAAQAQALFLQPDWFEVTKHGVGTNRYSYSFNDPVNRLDPKGNQTYFDPIPGIPHDNVAIGAFGLGVAIAIMAGRPGSIVSLPAPDQPPPTVSPIESPPQIGHNGGPPLDDETPKANPSGPNPPPSAAAGLAVTAATIGGYSGKEVTIEPGTNSPATIDGIDYSGHALDQMQGRGLPPSVIADAIANGTSFPTRSGTKGYYSQNNNVRVVVGIKSNKVVTVMQGPPKGLGNSNAESRANNSQVNTSGESGENGELQ